MLRSFASIFVCIVLGGFAHALERDPGKCDAVLAKDSLLVHTDTRVVLSILQVMDQKSFEELKKNTNGGITIPIEGIPVDIKGDWGKFQQRRSEVLQKYKYNYDSSHSRSIALSSVSEAAINAWSNCIADNTLQTLTLKPRFEGDTKVFVDAFWKPGKDGVDGIVENVKIDGGAFSKGEKAPKRFGPRWATLSFTRDPSKPFSLAINLKNGDRGAITFPAAKRQTFNASLSCREWNDDGCVACVISLVTPDNPAKSFAQIGVSDKSGAKTYLCRGMVSNSALLVTLSTKLSIDGGGSQFNWVALGLSAGDEYIIGSRENNPSPFAFDIVLKPQAKTASNGLVVLGLWNNKCQWNKPVYLELVTNCSVSAEPQGEITVQALGPSNKPLAGIQKIDATDLRTLLQTKP